MPSDKGQIRKRGEGGRLIYKAFKFRIYPNKEQEAYAETGRGLSYETCSGRLPDLKKELLWLKEVDSIALQSAVRDLADAYSRLFTKQNNAPRFKSKKNKVQSYTTKHTNGNIAIEGNKIKLPKLGLVRFAKSKEIEGRVINVTVRRTPSGKFFVSVLVETSVEELPKTGKEVGVVLGLQSFAVLSNGEVFENPRFLRRNEEKLVKEQRILSRRVKGSANWHKQRIKVAKIHERIANTRKD